MKAIITGLGQVGQELAKELIQNKNDVTVIDLNKELVESFTNKYDAIGIVGSGASREIQEKAKCENADIFIATTGIDEINLMSCLTAKYLGAKYVITKVKSLEYKNNDDFLRQRFKIDLVINSEHSTADEILRLISYPTNIKIEQFIESKINMAEITLRKESSIIGQSITELESNYKNRISIGCIVRNKNIIIPNKEIRLEENDIIYILASTLNLHKFLKKNKLIERPVKSVLIVGSGNIGDKLISNLIKIGIKIKVIEFDLKTCQDLSEKFEEVEVVYGEELNSDLLIEEGINKYDCCVSLTKSDESNLVISMFAWSCKTRKIITKVSSISYMSMLHNVEIDTTVSPYEIILSSFIKYIRGINNRINNSILELYRFANNQVEAIEFFIDKEYDYCNKKIGLLNINKNIRIAVIIRGKEVIIPNEEEEFIKGDKVIIISKANAGISQLEDIFMKKQ